MLTAAILPAQEVSVGRQRGPYYVGEPAVIQISVAGLDVNQNVVCQSAGTPVDGVTIEGPQVGRSSRSFTQWVNGRTASSETVTYQFGFQVTALRPGKYEVGPFVVDIDGQKQTVEAIAFDFEKLDIDPDMQLEASIEDDAIYVGEQVPLKISWAFAGELEEVQAAFSRLQIRSPMFDRFEFLDTPATSRTTLTLHSSSGTVEIDADVQQEVRDGREFVVVTGVRNLLAERAGHYEAIPMTCRTIRVTSWEQTIFGDLRARDARPALAAAEPLSFTVKELPGEGRPASFSGAVGRGYSLEVTADRSVVRVGDPISLDVTVRGDGNLEKLSLPDFALQSGMDESLFQLPDEIPAGVFSGNAKQFKLTMRVREPSVQQVPALGFSWFDPETEQYQTAFSKPIALQVMETQVVSAADVISAAPSAEPDSGSQGAAPATERPSVASPQLSLVGANLAIEKNATALLSRSGDWLSSAWTTRALYGLGVLLVAGALLVRRRQAIDPRVAEERQTLKAMRHRILQSRTMPARQAAEELAAVLREAIVTHRAAEMPAVWRTQVENLVAECESISYMRHGEEATVNRDWVDQALTALDRLTRK